MKETFRNTLSPQRIDVLGVHAHALDIVSAKSLFHNAIKRHRKGYVCFTSVHGVM